MGLKTKLFVEIIIFTIIFSLMPLAWKQFIFNPNAQKFQSSVSTLLETLVEMPREITPYDGDEFDFLRKPKPLSNKVLLLQTLHGTIKLKWEQDGQEIQLQVNPSISDNKIRLLRVHLLGQAGPNKSQTPTKIIKDQRAISVIELAKTKQPRQLDPAYPFIVDSVVETKQFDQEQDGLKEIKVHSSVTDPNYISMIQWFFKQENLPYRINNFADKFHYEIITAPKSIYPHPSIFFIGVPATYAVMVLIMIFIPLVIFSLIALHIASKKFNTQTFTGINLIFIPMMVIAYPVYYKLVSFFFIFLQGLGA